MDVCGIGVEHVSGAAVLPSLAGRLQMLAGQGHDSHMSSLMLELCVDQCILGCVCIRQICSGGKTCTCNDKKYLYIVVPCGVGSYTIVSDILYVVPYYI